MIWVPLSGGGPLNGYRYRDTLRPLALQELIESHDEATALVEELAKSRSAPLGLWRARGPALSVYAQWAVYALRERDAITQEVFLARLERLAQLQQRNRLYRGFPGIHYGSSAGWEAPPWWSGPLHLEHQALLMVKNPDHYTQALFELCQRQGDWRWAR